MECLRNQFADGILLSGRYKTVSPLNHGSFGMVFMAKDVKTDQTVAIKCLTKKTSATDACFEFAIDDKSEELVLHRRLGSHANIVNLLDSFETDNHIYLVLEFCEQGDLYEAIRMDQGPLETEHVRRFMLELVDAVAYIHSLGVYHRDIKPENIFLTQSGAMKLGDFGLATTERWTYETTVGSDRYMSPEQYDSAGAGYSPAQADIWAVGICLLNILFSRNPFTTPTEADPLFLDFSRDKQSLFDVFPSMSQDTYEVIVECMNLDPSKRSLIGARNALRRLVSFTTLDEALDDFCTADRRVVASSNREPLRTPSIQSPQIDTGAFPWARALQAPQKPVRQLSVIADNESYSEDLFSKSTATNADWFSGSAQTPSMSSVLDSSLGASMQSLGISRPAMRKGTPMAGSLPIAMVKPKPLSAMSLVFGNRKEPAMSKSWSDMWDEDVEEEEMTRQQQRLKELNSRTWSHESKTGDRDNTPRQMLSPVSHMAKTGMPLVSDVDDDLAADGFFFHDAPPQLSSGRYSPPSKRNAMDKWAALGERRRAHTRSSPSPAKAVDMSCPRQSSTDAGAGHDADIYGSTQHQPTYGFQTSNYYASAHHGASKWNRSNSRDRVKECPWNKGRDRDWNWNFNWRKDKRSDFGGDVEWVGGWQEAHS